MYKILIQTKDRLITSFSRQIVVEEIIIESFPFEEYVPTVMSPPEAPTSMFSFSMGSSKPKRLSDKEKELTKKATTAFVYMAHKVCCKTAQNPVMQKCQIFWLT